MMTAGVSTVRREESRLRRLILLLSSGITECNSRIGRGLEMRRIQVRLV